MIVLKNSQISYNYERVPYIIFGLISWPWVDFQPLFSNYSLSTKPKGSLEKSEKFQFFIIVSVIILGSLTEYWRTNHMHFGIP